MRLVLCLMMACICGLGPGAGAHAAADDPAAPAQAWVFLGTHTNAQSKGIYRLELDLQTGKLTNLQLAAETSSPSFVAIHPSGKYLYAVGETGGKGGGSVSAFALDRKTGALKFLNRQSSVGGGPCH